ncbi:hypothetical protein RHOSPDRAFT_31107 [Rhodotorula sp. JG-1b]|nr:hypothetical protein RHOSPDRAFT_31107 [Rhodotorula sp. JG-1b]
MDSENLRKAPVPTATWSLPPDAIPKPSFAPDGPIRRAVYQAALRHLTGAKWASSMPNPPKWAPLPPLSPDEQRSMRNSSSAVSSSAQPHTNKQQYETSTSRDDMGEGPGEVETVVASASAGVTTKESAQSTELSREYSTTRTVWDEGRNSLSPSQGGKEFSAADETAPIGSQVLLADDGEQSVQPLHAEKAE